MAKAKVLKAWGANRPGDIIEIDDERIAAYVRKGLVSKEKEFMGVTSPSETKPDPNPRRRKARRKKR